MDKLVISILVYNGGEVAKKCLDSILKQELPKPFTIQIVDNDSTDGSAEELYKNPEVDWLIKADNKHQFITGLNKSFNNTPLGSYCLFVSQDVFFRDGAIMSLWEKATKFKKSIIQPVFYNMQGKIQNAGMEVLWPGYGVSNKELGEEFWTSFETEVFATTAFIMSKEAFDEVGEFDERFAPAFYEDLDYSMRAKRLGYNLLVDKEAKADHYTSYSFSKAYPHKQIERFYHQNRLKLIDKHYTGMERVVRKTAVYTMDGLLGASRVVRSLCNGRSVLDSKRKVDSLQ